MTLTTHHRSPISASELSSNRIQSIIKLKEEPLTGPLHIARKTDSFALEKITREISLGITSTRQLMLTTGFGVPQSLEIPVRLPVLLLPGLLMMERMQEAGLPLPTYTVYQATEFIAETNGHDSSKAYECALRMESYVRQYVDRFHSAVANNVNIRFNCEHSAEIKIALEKIIENIRTRINHIDTVKQAIVKLQKYEQGQSKATHTYESYAAANALYSGSVDEYPFAKELPVRARAILPIGGNAERPFFAITSALADEQETTVIPFITGLGSRPTYYPYPSSGDPLTIDEYQAALRHPLKDASIRTDIAALYADGATPELLSEIYPHTL